MSNRTLPFQISEDRYRKLCSVASANGTTAPRLIGAVLASYLDGQTVEEKLAPPPAKETRSTRLVRDHLLTVGAQTLKQLEVTGLSRITLTEVLKQLEAGGEVIRDTEPSGGGRPAFLFVPVATRMRAAIERGEALRAQP